MTAAVRAWTVPERGEADEEGADGADTRTFWARPPTRRVRANTASRRASLTRERGAG